MRTLTITILLTLGCKSDPPCSPGTEKVKGECVEVDLDTGESASG